MLADLISKWESRLLVAYKSRMPPIPAIQAKPSIFSHLLYLPAN